MKIGKKNIDNFSAFVGMAVMFALCIIPKVSDFVISAITDIRNKIGSNK